MLLVNCLLPDTSDFLFTPQPPAKAGRLVPQGAILPPWGEMPSLRGRGGITHTATPQLDSLLQLSSSAS